MKNKYYCILMSLLFALSCCKRDNSTSPNVFTEASYPLAVGNWWQYQLISQGSATDTFMLNVVSTVDTNVYIKYNCNFVYNGISTPVGYFLQSDTSLYFINVSSDRYFVAFPNFHLKFPAEAGQYWQGDFRGDSIMVVGVAEKCEGSGGAYFSPCYSLVESYNLPHNFKVNRMLLTPKIGLVSQSIDFNSDTADRSPSYGGGIQTQQSVYLISYHIQ